MVMLKEQLCFRLDFPFHLGSHLILEFSERSFVIYLWLRNSWGSSVSFKWRKAKKSKILSVHNVGSFFYGLFYCCTPLFAKLGVKCSRTTLLMFIAQSYFSTLGKVVHV